MEKGIEEIKKILTQEKKWGVYFSLFYDNRDRKYCDSIINFKESEPGMYDLNKKE